MMVAETVFQNAPIAAEKQGAFLLDLQRRLWQDLFSI
jgi:hypothetical protein